MSGTSGFSPFEHERPLGVDDIRASLERGTRVHKIFIEEVHSVPLVDVGLHFMEKPARLLFRPFGEGKSTELNYIRYRYDRFRAIKGRKRRPIQWSFEQDWKARGRQDVFELLKRLLKAPKARNLVEAVSAWRGSHLLILLDMLENLSEDAQLWLLGNVHAIEKKQEAGEVPGEVSIVLSGSFGLGQISRDLFSLFYTNEVPTTIRSFNESHLKLIAERLTEDVGFELSQELQNRVRLFTNGEKRVIHLILDLALMKAREEGLEGGEMDAAWFDRAVKSYHEYEFRRDRHMQAVLSRVTERREAIACLRRLLNQEEIRWETAPPGVQKVFYNYALVEVERGVARFRSPFIRDVMNRAFGRIRRTYSFLREYLPSHPQFPGLVRAKRRGVIQKLTRGSLRGLLLWIYYGEVLETSEDRLRIQLMDQAGNCFDVWIPTIEFGVRLRPLTGFLKYCLLTPDGPGEEYLFYDTPQ